jgi:TorA-specific chaperone
MSAPALTILEHDNCRAALDAPSALDAPDALGERLLAYRFLATAYQGELTLPFLEALRKDPPLMEGELGDFISSLAQADLEQLRIDLAAEYAALFLGMSAQPVPPFESVYTSEGRLLMQEAHRLVVAEYARAGFRKDESFKLSEDHLALELEFMATLIKRTLTAVEAGDAASARELLAWQRDFFGAHILNWAYRFCDDVEKRAQTPFYRGLASLTRNCLDQEREFFAF